MKKNLLTLCTLFISIFAFISCDNATSTSGGSTQGIYTVDRNFIYPELIDTFYKIDNIADFDLKNGDRAYLTLAYEYDNYFGPNFAKYSIKSVESKLSVHGLTAASEIDKEIYSSPIIAPKEVLINMSSNGVASAASWLWKNHQNISIIYKSNGTEGDFKLSPVGLSGDTLCFALNAKIEDGDKYMTKLLSFDISETPNMLSVEDKNKLVAFDYIYTKISTIWYDEKNDTTKIMYPFVGKDKNCFKK